MKEIGRRILYLRSLDIDRQEFWALLLPFLKAAPSPAESDAWHERGELPAWMIKAESRARERQIKQEQSPYRWRRP